MTLPIDQLKTFKEVASLRNFTKAAEKVNLTQSAVSMQMKRLEDAVGAPLFIKEGKGFHLTYAGETLFDYAARILMIHDEALAVLSKPDISGFIRFGASDDFAARYLPGILSRFASVYPNVRVDVMVAPSADMKKMLNNDELDLILCMEINEGGEIVHRTPVVWIGPHDPTFCEQNPLPLAVYPEGCIFRKWATEALNSLGKAYRIAYTSPSIYGIMAAVKAGLAVAPVSTMSITRGLRVLGKKEGFPVLPAASVSLHRSEKNNSGVLERFSCFISDSFNAKEIADINSISI